jgi:hypothetical protein
MRTKFALGVGLLLSVGSVANAAVVWRGDFETGNISQWSKAQMVASDRLQVVSSPVREGKHALRAEVRQGDDPINASGNRAELVWTQPEEEGNDRYYSWSTMWPADYPSEATWQLFTQWHHSGNNGSPPLEMYVNGENMNLRVEAQNVIWTQPLERGKWHDFVLHVKWSSDPAVGFVEIWYDGKQVLKKTSAATMYPGMVNYLKQGLYRNETISKPGVIYHDGMTVGTTLADVMPASAPAPAPAPTPAAGATGTPAQPGGAVADGTTAAPDGADPAAQAGGCSVASTHGTRSAAGIGLMLLGLAITFVSRRAKRLAHAKPRA